ncbi:PQQ-dependent sugar dehydrogenase [Daejeonella sp.]|uniref:PQQ-dependent sugar dehydrogenase n=1 Tax=Daejeonella sp. TaxID=2805397 RepID=UPI0039837B3D
MKSNYKFLLSVFIIIMGAVYFLQAKQDLNRKTVVNPKIKGIPNQQNIKLTDAFPTLSFSMPVEFVSPKDATNRNFVVAQRGKIHVFANNSAVKETKVFLDIESKVTAGGERGLLGLAFHPNFKSNGHFYLNYTRNNPGLETVISRFTASKNNPDVAEPGSEEILLTFKQPYSNHNGGKIAFGNDGFLYIGVGDGGSGGDPQKNGQNRATWLGKILRIDVDKQSGALKYGIPKNNPYQGNSQGFKEEIFAYGIRNPWRFSFDKVTGDLWMGDVGQNKIEEIDIVKNGGNYGWNSMEAEECFGQANCNTEGMILPVWSYRQGPQTGNSVTGGHVYRGKTVKSLQGKYIYGDYVTGNIWALSPAGKGKYTNALLIKHKGMVSSFGEDANGELYICSYGDGKIYKIE